MNHIPNRPKIYSLYRAAAVSKQRENYTISDQYLWDTLSAIIGSIFRGSYYGHPRAPELC